MVYVYLFSYLESLEQEQPNNQNPQPNQLSSSSSQAKDKIKSEEKAEDTAVPLKKEPDPQTGSLRQSSNQPQTESIEVHHHGHVHHNSLSGEQNKQLKEEQPSIQQQSVDEQTKRLVQTINETQKEHMEVHKHPHNVMHKKKWTEYLLEFLMLFLAVFLGFLAENYREHIVEHRREEGYIRSMIEDLKADTVKLRNVILATERTVRGYDSLLNLLFNPPYSDLSNRMMYYLNRRYSGQLSSVAFTKRTSNELKNAGGMRLIRNKKVSDGLLEYDERTASADRQITNFATYFQAPSLQASYEVFDGRYYLGMTRNTSRAILEDSVRMPLLTKDQRPINIFGNHTLSAQGVLKGYIVQLRTLQDRCDKLIELLREEYHLEGE